MWKFYWGNNFLYRNENLWSENQNFNIISNAVCVIKGIKSVKKKKKILENL